MPPSPSWVAPRLAAYAKRTPRPVRFEEMLKFGERPSQSTLLQAAKFLADEISVRLAHRYAELETLPYGLKEMHAVHQVKSWYAESFKDLVEFYNVIDAHRRNPSLGCKFESEHGMQGMGSWFSKLIGGARGRKDEFDVLPPGLASTAALDMTRPSVMPAVNQVSAEADSLAYFGQCQSPHLVNAAPAYNKQFNTILKRIVDRHNPVVVIVGKGVRQLTQSHPYLPEHHPEVQSFLNRFHRNRVGVRILIGHHLALQRQHRFPHHIGIVCTRTSVVDVASEASVDAAEVCEQSYGVSPPVEIQIPEGGVPDFVYVPSHMHHIIFEICKNAMRAVVEKEETRVGRGEAKRQDLPPVVINVQVRGDDIVIRVSDKGVGIPVREVDRAFQYAYTTAKQAPIDPDFHGSEVDGAPMAGFGYGLPLSQLYARYFKGDLTLQSREGLGTDVFFTVKRDWVGDEPVLM
ncbi:uncharacterized protein SPPG_04601 [Spizellomyces punctatus DAOM BR117]|uniref:Protein-serine/threonine kinase n=1 Tax=Spizellomyces punctatus (strain DAOM BR117) TaxID=645134 RepID=A0A0L0HGQ3_SPIPD|nr:uncharacterized protein SPPG_04601 [Spizellomyces punctatus DAOM BR117]KND00273.1 hypothetical protein SPPG_04601 [Spizellomyces punctatus DAOM BR117]|eukprot:XP_016608312.1 hypothetical protein SPPG_04601 [Spizellomyces punctatus DAOM BR117]